MLIVSLALIFVAGCGDSNANPNGRPTPTGWEYRPQRGAYQARLTYVSQSRDINFVGFCEGTPVYFLAGGDYKSGETQFLLTVDDKSWMLPVTYHEHGRMLSVEGYEQEVAIARAKHRIMFQVGSWRREIRPGSELASFVKDCA